MTSPGGGWIPVATEAEFNLIRAGAAGVTMGFGTPYVGTHIFTPASKFVQVESLDFTGMQFISPGYGAQTTPGIDKFTGTYDGNELRFIGAVLSENNSSVVQDNLGIFSELGYTINQWGNLQSAEIHNMLVSDAKITLSSWYQGGGQSSLVENRPGVGFVGYAESLDATNNIILKSKFTAKTPTGQQQGGWASVGGFVGVLNPFTTQSLNAGSISNNTVSNCDVSAEDNSGSSTRYAGGFYGTVDLGDPIRTYGCKLVLYK